MEAIIPKDYPYSLKLLVLEKKQILVAEFENKQISRFRNLQIGNIGLRRALRGRRYRQLRWGLIDVHLTP